MSPWAKSEAPGARARLTTDREPFNRQADPPKTWTQIDRDYETLRLDMQTLFSDLGISTNPTIA